MLSSAYIMSKKKENYDGKEQDLALVLRTFLFILVIDLIFIAFAMYCLFTSGIPPFIVVLLFLAMLTPGIGFIVAVGVIVYHFANKHTAPVPKPIGAKPVVGFHFF